jgi:hypothetical protein
MSLINDALRRATTQNTERDPKELPPMQPTFRPARAGGPGFSIFVVCFLVAAILTLGLWIYWRRGLTATTAKPAPTAAKPVLTTNNNPLARASKTLGAVEAVNKEGENAADTMQKPASASAATVAPSTSIAATTTANGGVKLQGIFYGATPSAIINGKSMKVGDELGGVKVLSITQKSVRVQSGGEVRELTMK